MSGFSASTFGARGFLGGSRGSGGGLATPQGATDNGPGTAINGTQSVPPIGPSNPLPSPSPRYNATPAILGETAAKNATEAYKNTAFNKWVGGLSDDDIAPFQTRPNNSIDLNSARSHFVQNVLPQDQTYNQLNTYSNLASRARMAKVPISQQLQNESNGSGPPSAPQVNPNALPLNVSGPTLPAPGSQTTSSAYAQATSQANTANAASDASKLAAYSNPAYKADIRDYAMKYQAWSKEKNRDPAAMPQRPDPSDPKYSAQTPDPKAQIAQQGLDLKKQAQESKTANDTRAFEERKTEAANRLDLEKQRLAAAQSKAAIPKPVKPPVVGAQHPDYKVDAQDYLMRWRAWNAAQKDPLAAKTAGPEPVRPDQHTPGKYGNPPATQPAQPTHVTKVGDQVVPVIKNSDGTYSHPDAPDVKYKDNAGKLELVK